MTDAILIFTFSPIQSFISEARRAADLYAGSKILSQLANAAGKAIGETNLIFPANLDASDTPNKLVARVPFEQAEQIADAAKKELLKKWKDDIAKSARDELAKYDPKPNGIWDTIWNRQIDRVWEIYWAACMIEGDAYSAAYKQAGRALDAVKRTRAFEQAEEDGLKDTLSGRRSALRVAGTDAKAYWKSISQSNHLNPSQLRPDGKERLDALGAVKRFCKIADAENFASVSMVATKEYVEKATSALAFPPFRTAVEQLLREEIYRVRNDVLWPYDGDLFFSETLTAERLKDSYGLQQPDPHRLEQAQRALKKLHDEIGKPSPYYAIIQLDGDSMGEAIDRCEDAEQHQAFSESLADFAKQVRDDIVEKHHGTLIYNGGDDVLALAPLSQALPLARALADAFSKTVTGCHASAGIAIAHHLYPLDVALNAARRAEKMAKGVDGKNAVCVRALKRSGETLEARSSWTALADNFEKVVSFFIEDNATHTSALSSRLVYDVIRSAYALTQADESFQSELYRLLTRHRNSKHPNAPQAKEWAERLTQWAKQLPNQSEELGKWLAIARFIAQGGGE